MSRLKDRQRQIPNGLTFYEPVTRWEPNPKQYASFNTIVDQFWAFVQSNKFLAEKHGWPQSRAGVEELIDAYNAKLCEAHGWKNFIYTDEPSKKAPLLRSPSRPVASAIVAVGAGAKTLRDWLGDGGKPVDRSLAAQRARLCVGEDGAAPCPKHSTGDWMSYFTLPVAALVRRQLSLRSQMALETPCDERLNVCDACGCPLKLKVHVPIEHILKHLSAETLAALDERCWILREKDALLPPAA